MCANCGWEDVLDEILECKNAGVENDFLDSVGEWIEEREHVTDKQAEGVHKFYERLK